MTEACQTGMSIMETYFDMLNTKDLKKTADQLVDDDDEYEEEGLSNTFSGRGFEKNADLDESYKKLRDRYIWNFF